MDTQLIMLGTGHAMVTKCYNTCFAIKNKDTYFMVDAGGGNQIMVQLEKANIPYESIRHMFVTHAHTDHILGVIWMIRKIATLMNKGSYSGDFILYCHDEVKHAILTFCNLTLPQKITKHLDGRIQLQEVKDGEHVRVEGMELTFFDLESTKQKQFGFKAKFENETILSCCGDEPYKERNEAYVKGCDWLLHEAYCLYEEKEMFKPYEKNHSTAQDAGRLAGELNVKNLLLYHTEDRDLKNRKARYTKEAKAFFDGNVYVADDLEKIQLF